MGPENDNQHLDGPRGTWKGQATREVDGASRLHHPPSQTPEPRATFCIYTVKGPEDNVDSKEDSLLISGQVSCLIFLMYSLHGSRQSSASSTEQTASISIVCPTLTLAQIA